MQSANIESITINVTTCTITKGFQRVVPRDDQSQHYASDRAHPDPDPNHDDESKGRVGRRPDEADTVDDDFDRLFTLESRCESRS